MAKRRTVPEDLSAAWAEMFTFSTDGLGMKAFLPEKPCFPDEASAATAWRVAARLVWAASSGFRIPRAAEHFNLLTFRSVALAAALWPRPTAQASVDRCLEQVAADRASIVAFERREPDAAAFVASYLQTMREELDHVEAEALRLAAWPAAAEWPERPRFDPKPAGPAMVGRP